MKEINFFSYLYKHSGLILLFIMFIIAAPEKVMAACPTPRIGRERFIFYYIYYRRTSISMWSVELLRIVCGIPRVCLPCRARAARRNMLKRIVFL